MNPTAIGTSGIPRPDFGTPEAEFAPTSGQTAAGMLASGSATAIMCAIALFGFGATPVQRFGMAMGGVLGLSTVAYIWELRKWRVWVCPGGVVQRRITRVEEISWEDVREVLVEHYFLSKQTANMTLVRAGRGADVMIWPTNCGESQRLFEVLLKAVEDRGIPVERRLMSGD